MSTTALSPSSKPASVLSTPTSTGTALTTELLVLIAPSQTFNGSVIDANVAATTFLVNFPDSNALGPRNNATVTVGPASASSGNYTAEISIPKTGSVTAACETSGTAPTACMLTIRGPLTVTTNTIPSHTYLPVTITAGLEKLSAASTVSPSSSLSASSSSTGAAPAGLSAPVQYNNGLGLMALVGMFLGRLFL